MSARVNLLLLLSAMLSALTGVGGSARVREAPAVARVVVQAAKAAEVAAPAHPRPVLPALAALPAVALAVLALVPGEPIYAGRRRE